MEVARRNLMVNDNLADIKGNFKIPASELLEKIERRDPSLNLPSTMAGLPNSEAKEHLYTFKTASALGLSFGGVSADFKQSSEDKVFITEMIKYTDFVDGNLTIRFGVGMRIFYQLHILNIDAKVSSLPLILASAQFEYLKADVHAKVLGVPTFNAPIGMTLSLDSYETLKNSTEKFRALLDDQNTPISPQILSVSYHDPATKSLAEKYQHVSAQCFALKMIKKGYSLSEALAKCPKAPGHFQAEVKAVFEDFKGLEANVASMHANNALKNLSVTYHDKW